MNDDLNPYPKGNIDRDAWQDGYEGRGYDEMTFGRVGDPDGTFNSYGAFRNGQRFRQETRLMSETQKASHMKENMQFTKASEGTATWIRAANPNEDKAKLPRC